MPSAAMTDGCTWVSRFFLAAARMVSERLPDRLFWSDDDIEFIPDWEDE